jgi:hypothetical protein
LKTKTVPDMCVERIIIRVNSREHSLTVQEARQLMESLKDMFGDRPAWIPYPYYVPNVPSLPYTTCTSSGTSLTTSSFS